MIAPAASTQPNIVQRKAILAVRHLPASWTDPKWSQDIYVEAKTTLLLSIRDRWHEYRARDLPAEQRPRLRDLIRLKVTAYRFFDACRATVC